MIPSMLLLFMLISECLLLLRLVMEHQIWYCEVTRRQLGDLMVTTWCRFDKSVKLILLLRNPSSQETALQKGAGLVTCLLHISIVQALQCTGVNTITLRLLATNSQNSPKNWLTPKSWEKKTTSKNLFHRSSFSHLSTSGSSTLHSTSIYKCTKESLYRFLCEAGILTPRIRDSSSSSGAEKTG